MSVVIGGEKAWKVRSLGDLGIAYHWINDEPALVLYPLRKRIADAGAYVLCLSAAHLYVQSNGHPDLDNIIPTASKAAVQMGFAATDAFIIKKIVDVICDGMPDLVAMPPTPSDLAEDAVRQNVGEMAIKLDGQVISEKVITDLDANELAGLN